MTSFIDDPLPGWTKRFPPRIRSSEEPRERSRIFQFFLRTRRSCSDPTARWWPCRSPRTTPPTSPEPTGRPRVRRVPGCPIRSRWHHYLISFVNLKKVNKEIMSSNRTVITPHIKSGQKWLKNIICFYQKRALISFIICFTVILGRI